MIFIASCEPKEYQETKPDGPVVMAYYVPEKNYQPESIPVEKLTHIIFSFTHVIDGEMAFRDPEVQGLKLQQLVDQKERNPELKVMIACGGWGADGFSDMALTEQSRSGFIESAIEFVKRYELDGIDIDWEYPSISGAGTMARPEDRENFTLLMKGLREQLNTIDKPQTLTFASAGWKRYYDHIETEEVMKYADYMNVMTYDQVGGYSIYTAHHTPLGDAGLKSVEGTPFGLKLDSSYQSGSNKDPGPRSVEKIVNFLIDRGTKPEQIVIGAAFYGRAWKGVPPENKGLYQLSGGIYRGWTAYANIRREFESDGNFVRHWDEKAKASFLYNALDSILVSYDDTVSVRLKIQYAIDEGLGGVMFWELGNDTKEEGSLLDAIYQTTKRKDE